MRFDYFLFLLSTVINICILCLVVRHYKKKTNIVGKLRIIEDEVENQSYMFLELKESSIEKIADSKEVCLVVSHEKHSV